MTDKTIIYNITLFKKAFYHSFCDSKIFRLLNFFFVGHPIFKKIFLKSSFPVFRWNMHLCKKRCSYSGLFLQYVFTQPLHHEQDVTQGHF